MLAAGKVAGDSTSHQIGAPPPFPQEGIPTAKTGLRLAGDFGLDISPNSIGVGEEFSRRIRRSEVRRGSLRGWKYSRASDRGPDPVGVCKALEPQIVLEEIKFCVASRYPTTVSKQRLGMPSPERDESTVDFITRISGFSPLEKSLTASDIRSRLPTEQAICGPVTVTDVERHPRVGVPSRGPYRRCRLSLRTA